MFRVHDKRTMSISKGELKMSVLKIARIANPVLRKVAKPLTQEEIKNKDIQKLIENMIETMEDYNGVGLAAPQVSESLRIIVIKVPKMAEFPESEEIGTTVIINPEIKPLSDEKFRLWEGCLSIPDLIGEVGRTNKIQISGFSQKGKYFTLNLTSFASAVAQHEFDHLMGILYIDRIEDMKKFSFTREYDRYIAKR